MTGSSMRRRNFLGLLAGVAVSPTWGQAASEEGAEWVAPLRENIGALRAAQPGAVPVAFWDFDGTLLKGDCSEGFSENGRQAYAGLVETAIGAGLSRLYPKGSFDRFWTDYQDMEKRHGAWLAYGFLAQIFQGAKRTELEEVARNHFEGKLRPWFFAGSLRLWRELETLGVQSHVISASPSFFVAGAAPLLGLPEDRCHGIRLAETEDGRLSHEIVAPMTYAEGKAVKGRRILAELTARAEMGPRGRTPRFHPVAGFGNSHHTDGPMLRWIARHQLPSRKTFALMVNGGPAPPENESLFHETKFNATGSP